MSLPDGPSSRVSRALHPAGGGHNAVVVAQGGERWGATCPCGASFDNGGRGHSSASGAFTEWAGHRREIIDIERSEK